MRWCFEGVDVHLASDREAALSILRREEPQVVTLDLGLPPDPGGSSEGFQALEEILRLAPTTKVIVVTGREEKENAVKAVGLGASDFFQKPLDADILSFIVDRAFRMHELEKQNQELSTGSSSSRLAGIIASSSKMLEVCRMIEKIAPADVTTLLLGETGTGKEVLAKAIHQVSPRQDNPFVAINCGAIPENLLESELFGHEKGAFTGATQTKQGKIELADSGTLFLDEIGDMPMPLQVKLLRFLQERVIERVGGVKPIPVDVRVVCATHQNVQQLIDQNLFREDLYYRVSEISLNIPPIRERDGDAIIIAQALLKTFAQQMNRPTLAFNEDAMRAIKSYEWPGNVREIINKVKRAVIMADDKLVTSSDLELSNDACATEEALNLRQIRDAAEKTAITQAIHAAQNNMAQAARLLGITRPTLYNLTEKFGINTHEQ
ncbi:sigma-54-dependent Fis family transcriptional regulator [Oleiphilus sp. HI0078]|nr:sigma-54-dependent Fis family transcriptional regulator [Oleiphilus sp. HI0043]KZY46087.1 sigma-54-dependent Fis family transcriptional regulator [Oleiphilus sp. HI0050]KZY77036.1 sigma-54-dependent Fis family transcriptional regulator [Oleiphilus sp. HI0069]KZY89506.1 sigma-54-dependent Fis family transcriptional regulator [Oleiphilus sp. HI0072]KZZ09001.1 sigma-54-dependent Fis family transcriptional regulator [Oleiphilus sp. HI0078]KZZ36434.1 sigma-54-dependent Fis family transcriptional